MREVDYFSSEQLRTDLKGKMVRGGAFIAVAQAAIALTSLATIPILTRLLKPADFGLVAMVAVFTGLAPMFVDAGLSMATIQREKLTHQQVSNLFWLAALLGLSAAIATCMLSPLIAWFYDEPRLVPITIALSAASLFGGLTIQHLALLRRGMQLRLIAGIQVIANLLACIVGVIAAWILRSYWALVVLPLSASGFRMLGTWLACRWRPGIPRRGAGVRAMVGFGANIAGFNFVNYFARSGDNMLIGWWWGDVPLGLYERAYKLMMAPLSQVSAPLAQLFIPALSRLASEPEKYRRAYFRAISVFQIVSCPAMAFVAVMAPQVVEVFLGPRFEASGPVLRWLAIAGFIQPLTNSFGWLYVSQGRSREVMRWGLLGCSLIVVSFLFGLPWGPLGVARSYAAMICVVIVPLAIWFVGAKGPVSRADLWRLCGTAVIIASPTVCASLLVTYVFLSTSAILELALAIILSTIATLPLLIFTTLGHLLLSQFKNIVQHLLLRPHQTGSAASALRAPLE